MAWYRRSKLGLDMFRNLASGSKNPINRGKLLTSCLDDGGIKKKTWLKYSAITGVAAATSAAYLSNLETVPYSGRTHLVLVPRQIEKALETWIMHTMKKKYEGKILPATHPTSVRLRLIAKKLIDALHRDFIRRGYDPKYLEHLDWEVLVIDAPIDGSDRSYFSGTILVSTSKLQVLKSDAEIASFIALAVAHIVARHGSEKVTKCMSTVFLHTFLQGIFGKSAMLDKITGVFVYFPITKKLILEQDYIALLVMASAGYDPRVAVTSILKGEPDCSYWDGLFVDHPSAKKRLRILSQAQDEAMEYYRKSPRFIRNVSIRKEESSTLSQAQDEAMKY